MQISVIRPSDLSCFSQFFHLHYLRFGHFFQVLALKIRKIKSNNQYVIETRLLDANIFIATVFAADAVSGSLRQSTGGNYVENLLNDQMHLRHALLGHGHL